MKDNLDLLGLTIETLTELAHCAAACGAPAKKGGRRGAAAATAAGPGPLMCWMSCDVWSIFG